MGGTMITETDTAVRDMYARLIAAWNAHDADAFAALFAEDGVSIGFDGSQATGDEIREHLAAVFGDHVTAAYVAKVRESARSARTPRCSGRSSAWCRPAATT